MNEPNTDPYELIEIPGEEDIRVMALSRSTTHTHRDDSGSKSPWWMIQIEIDSKVVTVSTVIGNDDKNVKLNTYAELYGFHIECSRDTSCEIANQLFTGGSLRHDDCIIILPNADYVTDIDNAMMDGDFLTKVTIIEIGAVKGAWAVFQKIVFETNLVHSLIYDLDRVIVKFRIKKKTVTYTSYKQDGSKEGNSELSIDFSDHQIKLK